MSTRDVCASTCQTGEQVSSAILACEEDHLLVVDTIIRDRFDLRHRTVKCALEFRNCRFLEDVDFRYTRFLGTVYFDRCTFVGDFDSGNLSHSHTVYKGDFHCQNCEFFGDFGFNGVSLDGSAYFKETRFRNPLGLTDLGGAYFGQAMVFQKVAFGGSVSFNSVHCEILGYFDEVQFRSAASDVNFANSSYGKTLLCKNSTFSGGVLATSVKCGVDCRFTRCEFVNRVRPVDLSNGSFGGNMGLSHSRFYGPARFQTVDCKCGDVEHARFENPFALISFSYGSYHSKLDCSETEFSGPVQFNGLVCKGDGDFTGAKFTGKAPVEFKFAEFGINLYFSGMGVTGDLNLDSLTVGRALVCEKTIAYGDVILRNASVKRLSPRRAVISRGKCVDLRQFTFETLDASPKQARLLVDSQRPDLFSRDPYIQLERYYSRAGNEVEATEVYFRGQCALLENARAGHTVWTRKTQVLNWTMQWLTGYGVRTHNLLLPILLCILASLLIYSDENSLRERRSGARTSETAASSSLAMLTAPPGNPAPGLPPLTPPEDRALDVFSYSVDLLVPLDLGVSNQMQPTTALGRLNATLQTIIGWLLLPLLIASFSGVVKRQSNWK